MFILESIISEKTEEQMFSNVLKSHLLDIKELRESLGEILNALSKSKAHKEYFDGTKDLKSLIETWNTQASRLNQFQEKLEASSQNYENKQLKKALTLLYFN